MVATGASGQEDEDEKRKREAQANRSRLVARLLAASADLPQFLNDLITTQAVVVAGTEAVAFLIQRGEQSGFMLQVAAHVRPDGADEEVRNQAIQAFRELVHPCVQQNRDGAIELSPSTPTDEGQYCLVTLLRNEAQVVAVSAVVTRCRDVERAQQRLVSMQLVAGYFDLYTMRRKSEQALSLAGSHQDVLQYATAVGTAENFLNSAANLCNALATRLGAARVSLGWMKGFGIRVKALSHTENFDKRQQLIQDLQRVMEEAADQDEPVFFNPDAGTKEQPGVGEPSTQNVTREAAMFTRGPNGSGGAVLSVPLRKQGELVGVITLEWAPKTALPAGAIQGMTVAGDVLAPQLDDRYRNDQWWIQKTGHSVRYLAELAVGPKHTIAKIVCAVLLAAAVTLVVYHPMYHVRAPFQFATTEKRVLSAPYDGYLADLGKIEDEKIKAGMKVGEGTVLGVMETTDLALQKSRAESEALAYERQSTQLMAEGKTAQSLEARERANASRRQVELYALQIERGSLKAPIDGYLTKCEAEDRKGGQVKAGEALFEVARIDRLRVELSVNERDAQMIHEGQKGELATTSLPWEKYPFIVKRIVPQGNAKEGSNVFTVYGELEKEVKETWKPGMAGEAKVEIEKKPLYFHWTHRVVEWVRLKLWI
jgi:multidrug resistance efflux pump